MGSLLWVNLNVYQQFVSLKKKRENKEQIYNYLQYNLEFASGGDGYHTLVTFITSMDIDSFHWGALLPWIVLYIMSNIGYWRRQEAVP